MFPVHQIISPINLVNPPVGLSRKKAKQFNRHFINKLRSHPPYQKLIRGSDEREIEEYRNKGGKLHRIDGPALIVTDRKTGFKSETWYQNGVISRPSVEGPAKTIKYPDGGSKILYYEKGALHRYGGPSKIITDKEGNTEEAYYVHGKLNSMGQKKGHVTQDSIPAIRIIHDGTPVLEAWYNMGLRDRSHAPAVISNKDGIRTEEWWTSGQLNRPDGPARTTITPDGSSTMEYYHHGVRDRTDGPAYIHQSPQGALTEKWYSNGKLHRLNGPAVNVIRTDDGITHIMEFYEHGKLISGPPARIIKCEAGLKQEYYQNNKLIKTTCSGDCFCHSIQSS